MFRHIGQKVRGLAVALCVIGIIGSVAAGVALYLTKLADLGPCIAIAAGGALLSWISAWVMYCIGDTHVKIARLEDKLIPKPAYAEYLASSVPARGAGVQSVMLLRMRDSRHSFQPGRRKRRNLRPLRRRFSLLPLWNAPRAPAESRPSAGFSGICRRGL